MSKACEQKLPELCPNSCFSTIQRFSPAQGLPRVYCLKTKVIIFLFSGCGLLWLILSRVPFVGTVARWFPGIVGEEFDWPALLSLVGISLWFWDRWLAGGVPVSDLNCLSG